MQLQKDTSGSNSIGLDKNNFIFKKPNTGLHASHYQHEVLKKLMFADNKINSALWLNGNKITPASGINYMRF